MTAHRMSRLARALGAIVLASLVLAACAPKTVEVTRAVEVTRQVEVTRVVQVEVAGEATAAAPSTVVQVPTPIAGVQAAAPSGWDTEWSQRLGIKLLQTFDSSGPAAWDPAAHPLVFITTEGLGYGGFASTAVTTPGLVIIDAYSHEIVAAPHYDLGYEAYFEEHGLGVSPDGQWIYVPTGDMKDTGDTPGRWLIINARTLKLDKIVGTHSVPHHAKAFTNAEGKGLVMGEDFNWQIGQAYMRPGSGVYVFDPSDDNRIVGGINADALQANPYLAFASPDGKFISIGLPPGPIRDPDISHELEGSWAIVSTETWQPVKYYKGGYDPIWTAFSSDSKYAYLCDGGSDEVFKVDMEAEAVVARSRTSVHGAYGCHFGWDDINLWTIEKGESSHNRGKNIGLVDAEAMRPVDNFNTAWVRADHGTVLPDPKLNELWVTSNSSFEVVIWDMGTQQVTGRIPTPNGGSTHSGAFVHFNPDFTGEMLSDQNGLHGTALQAKRDLIKAAGN
jgi:DNA-binding beta-propeller fold protein YncE